MSTVDNHSKTYSNPERKVSDGFRVVIPHQLRYLLVKSEGTKIEVGDKMEFDVEGEKIVMKKIEDEDGETEEMENEPPTFNEFDEETETFGSYSDD